MCVLCSSIVCAGPRPVWLPVWSSMPGCGLSTCGSQDVQGYCGLDQGVHPWPRLLVWDTARSTVCICAS